MIDELLRLPELTAEEDDYLDVLGDLVEKYEVQTPEAFQSCRGEHSPVGHMLFTDLAEAGVHVATDHGESRRREESGELQPPARAARRNVLRLPGSAAHHQHVARIGAGKIAGDRQARRHFAREVFGAVHREVSFAPQKRCSSSPVKSPLPPFSPGSSRFAGRPW